MKKIKFKGEVIMDCPKEVISVFDNKGYTVDRYTINIMSDDEEIYIVACSKNPTHPLGVWSVDVGFINSEDVTDEDKHIGEEIDWDALPIEVKDTVLGYFDVMFHM
jgi:hypothetical protein